jgi:hypothetical protein
MDNSCGGCDWDNRHRSSVPTHAHGCKAMFRVQSEKFVEELLKREVFPGDVKRPEHNRSPINKVTEQAVAQSEKFVAELLKTKALPSGDDKRPEPNRSPINRATEQTFRNMFAFAADRGEGLIEYYMTRHKCGRAEAMQRAIEEREREARY